MMMTRRDWWIGVILIASALLVNAVFPRYEVGSDGGLVRRFDRWTGRVEVAANPTQAHKTSWLVW